jgi:predicted permease
MRDSSGQISGKRDGGKFARVLLVTEISATLALLVLAGLIGRSFQNLQNVKLGYDPQNVLTCSLALTGTKYQDPPSRRLFFRQLIEKLQARPEVVAAGAILLRPLEGTIGWDTHFLLPGQRADEIDRNPMANLEAIMPTYFRAIGTPLMAGRYFDESDDGSKPLVAVVSEHIARAMYGSPVEAVGQRFKLGSDDDSPWVTIVGVVNDGRYRELTQINGEIFLPYGQTNLPMRYLIVRTRNNASEVAAMVRRAVSELDPAQAVSHEFTLQQLVARSLSNRRFHSQLFLLFGCVSLVLAAIGVYGVVSDLVVKQTKELGIRIALGAQGRTIMAVVLRSELSWVVLAEGLGILLAVLVAAALRATLFGVGPLDAIVTSAAFALLFAVAFFAAAPAAIRASNTDPNKVLRN